jgi:CheY-like chemotaxis protein
MNGATFLDDQHELATHQPVHVLVVDDYADNASSLAMLLRLFGHDVDIALDGPAALRAAQAHRPDAVLLDLSMPGMDGLQVARRLRTMFPDRPLLLIALTAHGLDEDRRLCKEAGFDWHLLKPADPLAIEDLLLEFGHSV